MQLKSLGSVLEIADRDLPLLVRGKKLSKLALIVQDVIGVRLGEVVRGRQYRAAEDNQPKKRSTDRFRPSSVDGTQHTRYTIDRRDRKLHRRLVVRLRS